MCKYMNRMLFLKALADDTRIQIIEILLQREESVLDIVTKVGKSQPNVSLALKKLEHAGIAASRKDQKRVYYRITDPERIKAILGRLT